MFVAFGWAKIQTSRADYEGAGFDDEEAIDKRMEIADRALHKDIVKWMEAHDDSPFKLWNWQFTPEMNFETGMLQFHASRNRRSSVIWDLIDFIINQSSGSYGVVYVHDDEDECRLESDGAIKDYSKSFRVWRILDGELTEHADSLFSPFCSQNAFGDYKIGS